MKIKFTICWLALTFLLLSPFFITAQSFGQELDRKPLQPLTKFSLDQDLIGFFGRGPAKHSSYERIPLRDGLTWAEREKMLGYSVSGLDFRLPLLKVESSFQFSVDGAPDPSNLFGKSEDLFYLARDLRADDRIENGVLYTPDEIHRSLGRIAKHASSDQFIRKDLGIDARYRFRAYVFPTQEGEFVNGWPRTRDDAPKFDPSQNKVVGTLQKGDKIVYHIAIVATFINPESQRLLEAMKTPETMPEDLKIFNGPKPIERTDRILTHLLPDSYAELLVNKNAVTTKSVEREKYEIDFQKRVLTTYSYDRDRERKGKSYEQFLQLRKELLFSEPQAQGKPVLSKYKRVAFLVQKWTESETTNDYERYWVTDIVLGNQNDVRAFADNELITANQKEPVSSISFGQNDRFKNGVKDSVFTQNSIFDIICIDGDRIIGGWTLDLVDDLDREDRIQMKELLKVKAPE